MRILHLQFNLRFGGTETLLLDILRSQVDRGHTIGLLLINDQHEPELMAAIPEGVEVLRLNKPEGTRNPMWLWRFNRMIRSWHPDVVHSHNERSVGMVYGKNYRLAMTYHCIGQRNKWRKRLDWQFAVSKTVADDIVEKGLGCSQVVPNGIAVDMVAERPQRPAGKPLRIVQVGRLWHPDKAQELTLEALSMLPAGTATVDFMGDGPSRGFLESEAKRLGVDRIVRFLGSVERKDLYNRLADYDLSLLTSRNEGFGLSLAESLAADVPVLSSDIPTAVEVLDGGRLGSFFKSGDARDMARAINDIAEHYDEALAIAQQGRKFVLDHYSIESTALAYLNAYERIAAGERQ